MSSEAKEVVRLVNRELGRRPIDTTRVVISVSHGVVYLRGQIRRIRGYQHIDLAKEMEVIHRCLRSKPEIREVHSEDLVFR